MTYCEVEVLIYAILTSVLVGGEWTASRSGHFASSVTDPVTHWIGSWNRSGLGVEEKKNLIIAPARN
jgi:hypothetical protein